jgi:pimeloyl-ACP methyl ester carboxylesterase
MLTHYNAARYCEAVYPQGDDTSEDVAEFLGAYFEREGFDVLLVETATQFAAVIRDPQSKNVSVIFRGSNDSNDWALNVKAQNIHDPRLPGKIHAGFNQAYREIEIPLKSAIARLWDLTSASSTQTTLSIYGHSLGGALATLLAMDLPEVRLRIADVSTFGSPRVGNKTFARAFNWFLGHRSTRYVNENDIVPTLPPWLFGRSVHVGRLAWLVNGRELARIPPLRYLAAWLFSRKNILGDSFNDHSAAQYVAKLRTANP